MFRKVRYGIRTFDRREFACSLEPQFAARCRFKGKAWSSAELLRSYIKRWINYSKYFLELADQFKGSVFVARLEDSERQFRQMCAFLEQPFDEVVQNEMKLPFNDNPRSTQLLGAAAIRKSLEECRTQFNMDVGTIEAKLGY